MKKWIFIQEVLARFFHDHTLCVYSSGRRRAPDWLRADIGPCLHLNAEHSAAVPVDCSRAIIQRRPAFFTSPLPSCQDARTTSKILLKDDV